MFDIGRICVKIAGRDAGQKCVIVEVLDDKYVIIDGMTRRRKCNKMHLEPLNQKVDLVAKASHEDVARAFKTLDLDVLTTKPKQKSDKPKTSPRGKAKTELANKKEKKSKAKAEKAKKE
ncbi:MAG: 50S ribosomal protein L14e [Candidatus Woesearchaeota archaeon]